jgi:hypothetical protein
VLVAVDPDAAGEHGLAPPRPAAGELEALGAEADLGIALALEHLGVQLAIAHPVAGLRAARVDRDLALGAAGGRVEAQRAAQQAQAALDPVQGRLELEADLCPLGNELEHAALARGRRGEEQRRQPGGRAARPAAQPQSSSRSGMKSQSSR